tara:strand:+ start:1198 stop:1443 length:246 start_codon:yes stop_codon:yes gene_type:complete
MPEAVPGYVIGADNFTNFDRAIALFGLSTNLPLHLPWMAKPWQHLGDHAGDDSDRQPEADRQIHGESYRCDVAELHQVAGG